MRPSCRISVATYVMRPSVWTLLCLVVRLQLAFGPISATQAELHHQRHLPRYSTAADPGEQLSIHASASRATFAIGDHLLKWLAEHPAQHLTARRTADLTAEDVVFIVMVCPLFGIIVLESLVALFSHVCRPVLSGRIESEHKKPPGCVGLSMSLPFLMQLTQSWAS